MRGARWALGFGVAIALAAALLGPAVLQREVTVGPGESLQVALSDAPAGARVVLAEGGYEGPVTIEKRVEVIAEPGARIVAPADDEPALTIAADRVRVEGLSTVGGSTGIRVREVDGVQLEDVSVRGAELHGIEIIDASALVKGADVAGLRHELAQGIEIRNADGRPDSVVRDSAFTGGQEGIVSHVSEVVVEDNVVRETTLRGITITEMSDGIVARNTIRDAGGAGLYCGDMSRCEFSSNDVSEVRSVPLGRPTEGWGLVVTYHSAASSSGDRLEGESGAVFTSIGSRVQTRSPLEPGAGLGALPPVAATVALTLALLALVVALARPFARSLASRAERAEGAGRWILPVAVAGLLVQTFHMVEHWLQVFRVRVDGIPSRGGLAGPQVEAEWVHFTYNGLVLVALVAMVVARKRGWRPPGRRVIGDHLLVAAVAIQGYHQIEHSMKLMQHVTGGAKVNPGIAGRYLDLVLFHFGINLAVYLACLGAAFFYAFALRTRRTASALPRYAPSRG